MYVITTRYCSLIGLENLGAILIFVVVKDKFVINFMIFFYFSGSLDAHLSRHSVEYIQFAFRWMNNLLMREFPLRCVIRLWDSYLVRHLVIRGKELEHIIACTLL